MFLIVSKVARELFNDFELTSLHIEFLYYAKYTYYEIH